MSFPSIDRPWLQRYSRVAHAQGNATSRDHDGLTLFRQAAKAAGAQPALHYFDATLSYAELDAMSDAFATFLLERSVEVGDRVALYMQNIPQFVICLLGIWKRGAIAVTINPMNRRRELQLLLQDCGARMLVLQEDLWSEAQPVLAERPGTMAVLTSVRDFQSRNDARLMPNSEAVDTAGAWMLADALRTSTLSTGGRLLHTTAKPDDIAVIVYTSGTTGRPKGALITHANLSIDAQLWRAWIQVRDGAPILAIAPLFHITGLVGHMAVAWAMRAPMILAMRFHPEVIAEAAREYRAEFTVGAITAFIAIMNSPTVTADHLSTLQRVYSGGAPVPAAVASEFQKKFGLQIRNCYGLTESSSLAVAVPHDLDTPVDAQGAYSIGVPVFDTNAYIADDAGAPLPFGDVGEIMLRGPQIVPGYWQRQDETVEAFFNGFLRTGDIGYMNAEGWLFIVDRKKDMISASGYKVWPKEVEDVIYTHPAIREAAVVGMPDGYRGETVKAVVSLKPGHTLDAAALIAFCKERMAAYKYPRQVEFLSELPKTATGKILRRALR